MACCLVLALFVILSFQEMPIVSLRHLCWLSSIR